MDPTQHVSCGIPKIFKSLTFIAPPYFQGAFDHLKKGKFLIKKSVHIEFFSYWTLRRYPGRVLQENYKQKTRLELQTARFPG